MMSERGPKRLGHLPGVFYHRAGYIKDDEFDSLHKARWRARRSHSTFDSINQAYGSSGSFASKNNEATDGLNSASTGDIRLINSIGKYPSSFRFRVRNSSLALEVM